MVASDAHASLLMSLCRRSPPTPPTPTHPSQVQPAMLSAPSSSCICSLQDALAQEHAKRAAWRDENIRRRHNYIPLLFNMLKVRSPSLACMRSLA